MLKGRLITGFGRIGKKMAMDHFNVIPDISVFAKGVFFYPGYYRDDQGRGDQVMIAPPFIITEEQIDRCIEVLQEVLIESQERVSVS